MRYDGGYGRGDPGGRGQEHGPVRGYDFGLRGYRQTAPERAPVRVRHAGQAGGYDRGYHGRPPFPNRVTQRYNREYVHPQPNRLETNPAPYGGDVDPRIVDAGGDWRPYVRQGGSRTWRGGGLPVGWEREADYARYDADFRGYYGPMR